MTTTTATYGDRAAFLATQIDPAHLYLSLPDWHRTDDHQTAVGTIITAARRVVGNRDHVAEEVLACAVYLHTVAQVICTIAAGIARRRWPDRPGVLAEISDYYTAVINAGDALTTARGGLVFGPADTQAEAQATASEIVITARRALVDAGDLYAAHVLDHLTRTRYPDWHAYDRADRVAQLPEDTDTYTIRTRTHTERIRPALVTLTTTATELGDVTDPSHPYAALVDTLPAVYCAHPGCTHAGNPYHHHYTRLISA